MRVLLLTLIILGSHFAFSQEAEPIDSLLDASINKIETQQLDSALEVLNMIEEQIADDQSALMAKLLFNKGYAFDYHGALDTALYYYDLSERIYVNDGDFESVANCINYKAGACFFAGDYDQAMKYYLDCLNYTEAHDLNDTRLKALINLGVVYRVTDKIDQAIEIYRETLQLSKEISDTNMVGASYHNIGVAYSFGGETEDALTYLDSALSVYTVLQDTLEMGRTSNAIGDTYYMNGKDLDMARSYLLKAETYLIKYNQQEILANTYLTLGHIEKDVSQYDDSKRYYEKGLTLLNGTDRSEQLKDFYLAYQSLLYKMGNYKASHDYLNKYVNIQEELGTEERTRAIEELQTKYDLEKKENQIELLNSQNEIQLTRLKARRNQLTLFSLAALLLLCLLGIVYRLYRQLKEQNAVISQALKDKDVLMREVHHRVKNNLQMVSGLLNLQSDYIQEPKALKALHDSEVRVQSIALLHQDLYSNENLRDVNSKTYIEKLLENLEESYNAHERGIRMSSDIESLYIDVESMIPIGLIINELVTNALKHAFPNQDQGQIQVGLRKVQNNLELTISDNGRTENHSELNRDSFGYNLIENFALRLDAEMSIDRTNGYTIQLLIKKYTNN